MSSLLAHPSLAIFAGALLLALLRGAPRAAVALLAPLVSIGLAWNVGEGTVWRTTFLGMEVAPFAPMVVTAGLTVLMFFFSDLPLALAERAIGG